MPRILITGGDGLLGSSLVPFLEAKGLPVETVTRTNQLSDYNVDLSDRPMSKRFFDSVQPDVIVNLAGLTDVDFCEASPNISYRMNVRIVENIAYWINNSRHKCHLVHISTDHLYDGPGLHEEENVTLTNYYAFSKFAGELAAQQISSTIFRCNFFGKSQCQKRRSLSDWLFTSLSNADHIQVFEDVLFTPLSMMFLCEMILLAINKRICGVFNVGSAGGMSKADFAFHFASLLGFSTKNMVRTTTDKVNFLKIYRPKDMRMNCSKFENAFQCTLPSLSVEISKMAAEYEKLS